MSQLKNSISLRIDEITRIVTDGETIHLGDLAITCMSTHCHTSGQLSGFTVVWRLIIEKGIDRYVLDSQRISRY